MTFLNEITAKYPEAISFAPGRPADEFIETEMALRGLQRYVRSTSARRRISRSQVWAALGQYSSTEGMIQAVIAAHLATDEGIHVDPRSILVTVGAQEAMTIVLLGLFEPSSDILLASDPTYIGITSMARLIGIRVMPVPATSGGVAPEALAKAIAAARRLGRVRAFYDIPDFNNPLGSSMPLDHRREILSICRRNDVLVIEDNPYGMFAYDGERLPTLKALDQKRSVIHIGTFSKTLFPGLRVGYLIADQRLAKGRYLAQPLAQVKSLLTVNTPPLLQAAVASILVEHKGSLERIVAPKRAEYKRRRDAMLAALTATFGKSSDVEWSSPSGGFFVPVTLPFNFGQLALSICAGKHGVIVCPMTFFCHDRSRRDQVRLSFSAVSPDVIAAGVQRFGRFVRSHGRRRPR